MFSGRRTGPKPALAGKLRSVERDSSVDSRSDVKSVKSADAEVPEKKENQENQGSHYDLIKFPPHIIEQILLCIQNGIIYFDENGKRWVLSSGNTIKYLSIP